MRYLEALPIVGALISLASFSAAMPPGIALHRRDSPDETCGGTQGYSCGPSNVGPCCSYWGWCGAADIYCGSGCQAAFGTCTGRTDTGTTTTSETEPPTTTTSLTETETTTTNGTGTTTTNGTGTTTTGGGATTTPILDPNLCGPTNGNASCVTGSCCSAFGYCGTTAAYCLASNGCQAAFGSCNGTGNGTSTGGNTNCGPAYAGQTCPTGQCCSPVGFCGTTVDHCKSPDCLRGFGICDSDHTPVGSTTADIPRPALGTVPYGQDIFACNREGTIALTYDDGPFTYTNDLLDKLAAYNFKATFFITGNNNGKGPIDETAAWKSVIERMVADGHQIASHTWSHADLSTLSDADRETEMVKNEMALRNIMGKIPTYMRPPYSSCNAACQATMTKLGYHITYFDLDTQDYLHTTPETNQISKDVVQAIISVADPATTDYLSIAHDIHEQTVHNLTTFMFDQMVARGFTGVTAGDCLQDPVENWYRT